MLLTELERAVVADWVARRPEDGALADQLAGATVGNRENTGAGYYTDIEPSRSASPLSGERMRSACWVRIEGFKSPVGHVLWLEGGYLTTIEGFTVGDDSSGIDWSAISFEIMPPGPEAARR